MSNPVNFEKEINDWSFDDLCKWAAWEVTQGMYQGKPLRSIMYGILQIARQWNPRGEIK
jgi:hypothetical protein